MNFIIQYFSGLSVLDLTLSAVFLLLFLIQLYFILIVYKRPYKYNKKQDENTYNISQKDLPGISVIITSKDSAVELENNLPFILDQDYPEFEVIVVNRGSTDDTDIVLNVAGQKYNNLYHTFIPQGADEMNEKKLALTLGIKAAKYENLLFTESYCKPSSRNWVREYGKEFSKGRDIVLGYSKIMNSKGAGLRKFIRYDNLIQQLKFLSMAIAGKPFMGIGRNMAYKKDVFFNNKGFSSVLGVDGGEDDLFINKVSKNKNTGVVVSPDSMTETSSVEDYSTWRNLKSKYLYTKQFYKNSGPFGVETFSKYFFYLLFILAVITGIITYNYFLLGYSLLLFILRFVFQIVTINKSSSLFGAGKFHINLIFMELYQPISNLRIKKYAKRKY